MAQKVLKKKTILDKMTKDEVAKWLYEVSAQKNLIVKAVSKFRTNSQLSMVLDHDGVASELNLTIASVLDRIERYSQPLVSPYKPNSSEDKMYKKAFKNYQEELVESQKQPSLNEAFKLGKQHGEIWNNKLRLDSKEDVEGYFIASFFNNVLKVYTDFQTDKRKGNLVFFEDYSKDNNDNKRSQNKMMSYLATSPEKEKDFNSTIVEIASFLEKEDSKKNNISDKQNKSQLSKLFLAIVDQKVNLTNEEIREQFNWSPYLLRKNKEELIEKVRSQFEDRKEEIIKYLDDREVIGK